MKYFSFIFLLLIATNLKAQNNFQSVDLKISKDNKMIDLSEIQNGLLVDNYNQLVNLITKHSNVKLSQEFRIKETDFFKNYAYYFVQIPTHCNQPELHNIFPKFIEPNEIEVKSISIYSGPFCPGVKYSEVYAIILPKKHLTEKKIVVTIKQDEVQEHPADILEILYGNWIEGEYNDSTKTVDPSKWRGKKQTLSFLKAKVTMTERGGCTPVKRWRGKYQFENSILNIEYLDFKTPEGIEKEVNTFQQYRVLKLTENELILFDLLGFGDETSYKGYLRN